MGKPINMHGIKLGEQYKIQSRTYNHYLNYERARIERDWGFVGLEEFDSGGEMPERVAYRVYINIMVEDILWDDGMMIGMC